MTKLEIKSLADNVEICFAHSRDNATFTLEQRDKWLYQGVKLRECLKNLISKEISQAADSKVIEANTKLKSINQRLQDKQESLNKFSETVEDITNVVAILDIIIGLAV
ncbi:hypothetical protein WKK05_01945 [Nostoc sp. UHCC 0302]|uniref:hypothetical protein n=1 Tax=Nostoc sp. UHCC 0302 TaxID=3134896 RepID=UPI00311C8B2F